MKDQEKITKNLASIKKGIRFLKIEAIVFGFVFCFLIGIMVGIRLAG